MDLNILTIILSALTLLFTMFTAFIALLAIWEWKSVKAFERKKKEITIRFKQITVDAEKEIKQKTTDIEKLINELKDNKNKKKSMDDFQKYEIKTEELVAKLENAIRNAEDKVNELKVSNTSTDLSASGLWATNLTGGTSLSGGWAENTLLGSTKRCSFCGNNYSDKFNSASTLVGGSKCPHCGNINY